MQLAEMLPGRGEHPPDRFRTHGAWSVSEIALSSRFWTGYLKSNAAPTDQNIFNTAAFKILSGMAWEDFLASRRSCEFCGRRRALTYWGQLGIIRRTMSG